MGLIIFIQFIVIVWLLSLEVRHYGLKALINDTKAIIDDTLERVARVK